MKSRLEAAEALLATTMAGRHRIAALAHAHLPFDAALRIELKAASGTHPARFEADANPPIHASSAAPRHTEANTDG